MKKGVNGELISGYMEAASLSKKEFHQFSKLIYQWAGINLPLTSKNETLVKSRLGKLLRKHNLNSFSELLDRAKERKSFFKAEITNALTTNTTYFYREERHFEILKERIRDRLNTKGKSGKSERGNRDLRIWCAASSTGQEPYTMLIAILEVLGEEQLSRLKFLATDIDTNVLDRCVHGVYSSTEVEKVSKKTLEKYFDPVEVDIGKAYRIKEKYRNAIRFSKFNLLASSYPFKYKFDFIFCRNVIIYFDEECTRKVVNALAAQLKDEGCVFFGHSESSVGAMSKSLKFESQGVYRKR